MLDVVLRELEATRGRAAADAAELARVYPKLAEKASARGGRGL